MYTNLMNCPDCTQTVSVNALTCPHCGRPLRAHEANGLWHTNWSRLLVLLLILGALIWGITKMKEDEAQRQRRMQSIIYDEPLL